MTTTTYLALKKFYYTMVLGFWVRVAKLTYGVPSTLTNTKVAQPIFKKIYTHALDAVCKAILSRLSLSEKK